MREPPRRRRADDEPSGGLPLFPLVIVVILAGLLLGGVLAHFMGRPNVVAKATSPPVITVTPIPSATPAIAAAFPSIVPSAAASAKPSAQPSVTPSATPSATPTPTPTPASSIRPSSTPSAMPSASPKPPPPKPAIAKALATKPPLPKPSATMVAKLVTPATPHAAVSEDRASSVVRSYLEALARGDRATAGTYLAHGTPGETFVDANTQIVSIQSGSMQNGQYKVSADMRNSLGEFYETFELEPGPGGLQITSQEWIKPQ